VTAAQEMRVAATEEAVSDKAPKDASPEQRDLAGLLLKAQLTFSTLGTILWPMKAPIYLTDPAEMRKARLNQPRVTSEQAQRQRELLKRASEKFSEDARKGTSSRGHATKGA
jgi:hypothetical protein